MIFGGSFTLGQQLRMLGVISALQDEVGDPTLTDREAAEALAAADGDHDAAAAAVRAAREGNGNERG